MIEKLASLLHNHRIIPARDGIGMGDTSAHCACGGWDPWRPGDQGTHPEHLARVIVRERQCAACPEPVHDQFVICKGCTRRTRAKLADQEANRQELLTALARDTRMTAPNDGGRSAERPLPIDPRAGDLLAEQRAVLVAWCRLLHDEHQAPYPADTVAAMACHIEAWLDRLALHEAAGELVTEIRDLEQRILRAIDQPENRTRITVGPCPVVETYEVGEWGATRERNCPGEVEAIIPRDEGKRPVMRCRCCSTEWHAESWARVGELIIRRKEVA